MKSKLIALLISLLTISAAHALEKSIGQNQCSDWRHAAKGPQQAVLETWVVAYLEGISRGLRGKTSTTVDMLEETTDDDIMDHMAQYCARNPISSLMLGATEMVPVILGIRIKAARAR